jgi:hypothetical protein
MTRNDFLSMACGVALAALVSMPAVAQEATEVTAKGTIEKVEEYPSRSGWHTGQHVMLATDSSSLEVHLGPTDYWKKNGFELNKGDLIEVTGSKTTVDDAEIVLAREIKKGKEVVILRNAQGVPAWSRNRRSQEDWHGLE